VRKGSSAGLLLSVAALIFLLSLPASAQAATAQYPNLRTLSPRDLRFDTTDVSPSLEGVVHNVLRFSNTVWNAGAGPLELRGTINPETKTGTAFQRVYDNEGGFTDNLTGNTFYWHAAHQHYHFDNWGRYELWTMAGYEAWIASGRTEGNPVVGSKTTSCVEDEEFIKTLPNQPYPPAYSANGCFPNAQNLMLQGLSPGWGDTYDYYRPDQWIDLGENGKLSDGTYVLRSVVDPLNKIYESPGKADSNTESQIDNEAITIFKVEKNKLLDSNPPDGSIRINDIDASTASPAVTVKVLGRDDISGVSMLKLSNDGEHWSTPQTYTGSGSTAQAISWSLTNPTYGGTESDGTKTVYVEFQDASGKWSTAIADTILLDRKSGTSPYSNAVLADAPAGYWRLGDTGGSTAVDSAAGNNGTYLNGPALGQASLLAGDAANPSVRFDGSNDYVKVPTSSALSPTGRLSLEAWIKPAAIPSAGQFVSILTKSESYALQFNGPRLEFTIIQSGTRKRLQAPSGAVVAGQVYHVVGTYDGSTQRLYLNGKEVANTILGGEISANASPLTIGSWNGSEFFNGTIDEAAVYAGALSKFRVETHYQAGIGGTLPDNSVKAPSNLTATPISEKQISLHWTDNSETETEFVIQRDTSSSFSNPTTLTTWADNTTYTDAGLSPSTTYYYRVRAHNATDTSEFSNVASAITTATPTGYRGAVLADNPVSYWRLGEASGTTAADERAANPGTYVNSPTLGASSLLTTDTANKAVTFDGTNDQVKVPNSAPLNLTGSFSLEAWIKPSSLPAAGQFASVMTKAESYSLQFNGPRLEFTIMQAGVRKRLQAPTNAVLAGTVYHVVASYDGTTQRLYLNGKEVASTPLAGGASSTANALYLGSWGGSSEFFKGTIDDAAVYGSALSAAQVSAHYAAAGGSPAPVAAPSALTATAKSTSQIALQWTDNASNETGFVVERSTSSTFSSPVTATVGANTTTYSDGGLAESTNYFFRVKAVNGAESSAYSNTASAMTQGATPTGYRGAVLADNPVSYWRLGEASGTTAADERAANPGTYVNSPTLGASSLLTTDTANKAVTFDGTNDQVKVPNSAPLNLTGSFSLEAWIKPSSLPAAGQFASVMTKAESYSLQFNGPRLEFTIMQAGVRKRLQAPTNAVLAGTVYHVVASYDGTTQRLYLNGKEVASTPLAGGASSTANALYLGSWGGSSEFFKGTIDDAAVYGSALSAAQVSAHYAAATSTTTTTATTQAVTDPFLLASFSSSEYSIASEPTTFDYCQLERPAILKGAEKTWRPLRS
jgi:Concanavalin A-like lectin/glucanases superfamily/Fibronectin type III domain/Lysyl oxidase